MRVFQRVPEPAKQFDAERLRQAEQRAEVRPQRRDLVLRAERDVDVLRAVVVLLDRQLAPLHAEGGEQRAASAKASQAGTGCTIRPKTIRPSSRSSRTGTIPSSVSSRISSSCSGAAEHEGRPQRRVAGERQLDRRREDPDPRVAALLGREARRRVSERLSSRASRCISSASSPRASVKTATGFPASGVSVKTSATT